MASSRDDDEDGAAVLPISPLPRPAPCTPPVHCTLPTHCTAPHARTPHPPHWHTRRYYVAEGVRLYSQETWRLVMGERGREEVAKCAPQVGGWVCWWAGGERRVHHRCSLGVRRLRTTAAVWLVPRWQ